MTTKKRITPTDGGSQYEPSKIEPRVRRIWEKEKIFSPNLDASASSARKPYYNLMMFPYPSAEGLHVGNMYAFTGSDIWGRYQRMRGYEVFEPMGLDGFGIHSENYAIKIGEHPVEVAKKTQDRFYEQLRATGNAFDWARTLETYDPGYYKWTQWLFIQMFKAGLAYREKATVNWCPSCKTVLADEQVIDDHCERCNTKVELKKLEQWFFKITGYAERLLAGLDKIDWPEKIKIAQRNWIGRSEGAEIEFPLAGPAAEQPQSHPTLGPTPVSGAPRSASPAIRVFTTRPDTLFGATFVVVSPELAQEWLDGGWKAGDEVKKYVEQALANRSKEETEREKTGVFSGIYAINPVNQEKIPVWVADYVLAGYGTGAIMAVPAHDERDFEFAKKYNLPIKQVIAPHFEDEKSKRQDGYPLVKRKSVYCILCNPKTGKYLTLDWGSFDWHTFIIGGIEEDEDPVMAAKREITEETGYKNIRFVRKLGRLYGSYFAAHKKENRLADAEGFLFELINDDQQPIRDHEKELHALQWMKPEGVEDFINISSQRYIWEQFKRESAFTGEGLLVESGKFSGMESKEAKWEIVKSINGEKRVNYHLRDWLISRQRYWGPPIPMIYCRKCWENQKSPREAGRVHIKNQNLREGIDYSIFDGEEFMIHPVPEKDLPVKLPFIKDFRPTGSDKSPLTKSEKFYKVRCPQCKAWAYRETDVSDTFLDSSWYFLRYLATDSDEAPFPSKQFRNSKFEIRNFAQRAAKWLPVSMYIGGAEHSVLHLMYVRFVTMALRDWGYLAFEEPFPRFYAHGLLIKDGAKMSKSKGNVVVPDEYIKKHGADTLRMYLMFLGPFDQGGDFRDTGIEGMFKFIRRVWELVLGTQDLVLVEESDSREVLQKIHQTIKRVTEDMEDLRYNRAIAGVMEFVNFLQEVRARKVRHSTGIKCAEWEEALRTLVLLLAPFAPHMTEELFQFLRNSKFQIPNSKFGSVHFQPWPKFDPELAQAEIIEIPVQVNGKLRGTVKIGRDDADKQEIVEAQAREVVRKYLVGVKKVVFVPGRLINFVV